VDSLPEGSKPCASCKQVKPFSNFSIRRDRNDGLDYYCKSCVSVKNKAWREVNRPVKEVDRAVCTSCQRSYERTSEFFLVSKHGDGLKRTCRECDNKYQCAHYEKNRERCIAQRAVLYKRENPETRKARRQDAYYANVEHCRALSREARRRADPEKERARARRNRAANPETARLHARVRKARKRAGGGTVNSTDIKKRFQIQKGRCWWCGTDLKKSGYHVDHVIALANGGSNDPSNIVCACKTCNLQKGTKSPLDFAGRLF